MRIANSVPLNKLSPWQRFLLTLQLDPMKAGLFYGIIGILLFTIVVGGFYTTISGRELARAAADLKDSPVQTATTTVQGRTPWNRSTKTNPSNSGLTLDVRIGNKLAATPAIVDERTFAVRIGDRIKVTYRVGKSGAIYIDEWQPLSR
jgi:hypothetical protein